MFDHVHLVKQGAYSAADAARVSFIHGLDTVHGDLKPENIMLSMGNSSDAVVKLVDLDVNAPLSVRNPLRNSPVTAHLSDSAIDLILRKSCRRMHRSAILLFKFWNIRR
jgi:serine/threonine protein kinase